MKFLLSLVVLSFAISAHAQVTSTTETISTETVYSANAPQLWLTAGPSFSTFSTPNSVRTSAQTGINFGAEIELPVAQYFSVQTGLDYVQKGVSIEGIAGVGLDYLEIPLLAKLNFNIQNNRLSFYAGPYAAFAVGRGVSVNGQQTDFSDQVRSTDFGGRFGLGFAIPLRSNLDILLSANYDLGFVDISSQDTTAPADQANNSSFMTMVGIGIKI